MEIESGSVATRKMRGRGTYGTNGVGDDLNLEVGHVGYINEDGRCVSCRKREYERDEEIRVRLEKLNPETSQACTPTFVAYRSPRISTAVNLSAAEVDLKDPPVRQGLSIFLFFGRARVASILD